MAEELDKLTKDELIARLKESEEIITGQAEALQEAEAQKGKALPVLTFDRKKYQVTTGRFLFGGEEYTAEKLKEAAKSEKRHFCRYHELENGKLVRKEGEFNLVECLLKMKSNILKPL